MKRSLFFLFLTALVSLQSFGQDNEFLQAKHPFRIQVYTGGPSLLKTAFKISENYQDEITYSGVPQIGLEVDYKLADWISVGVDCSYRYGQLDFNVQDTAFFREVEERIGFEITEIVNPYGDYVVKVPRFRGMAKVNFHVLPADSRSDLYFTAGIGYNRFKPRLFKDGNEIKIVKRFSTFSWPVSYRTSMGYSIHPIENVGLFAEVGIGGPIISGGVTVRF